MLLKSALCNFSEPLFHLDVTNIIHPRQVHNQDLRKRSKPGCVWNLKKNPRLHAVNHFDVFMQQWKMRIIYHSIWRHELNSAVLATLLMLLTVERIYFPLWSRYEGNLVNCTVLETPDIRAEPSQCIICAITRRRVQKLFFCSN